jgi:transposase-like protein
LARYMIAITPENPDEPSARVAIEYTDRRGGRVLEWSVVAGRNGSAPPPVLEAIIASIDADGADKLPSSRPSATADLGLSAAAAAALWKAGIARVVQLTAMTEDQLRHTPGVQGAHTDEIIAALRRLDLGLAVDGSHSVSVTGAVAVPRQRNRWRPRRRPYRFAPENLPELYSEYQGRPTAIARALDVPSHTVQNWIRTARNNGRLPPLDSSANGAEIDQSIDVAAAPDDLSPRRSNEPQQTRRNHTVE